MIRTEAELRKLATPEFSRVLARDPELRLLKAKKFDRAAECAVLLETLELGYRKIGALPILPLTAAKWSFLWLLESPFVVGGTPDEAAVSTALYILSRPRLREIPGALHEIPALASGYARATMLPLAQTVSEIRSLRDSALRPLSMLPPAKAVPGGDDADSLRFDAVWLNRMAGIAAREANVPLSVAMHELPLATVCCCFVNRVARESLEGDQVRRRPDAELARAISARIAALEERFLKEGSDHADSL